jgi:hypothetical protein
MADPLRPVRREVWLIDTQDEMPRAGANVLAIGPGGKLCEVVWTSRSHESFHAWMHYPKIPQSVKRKLAILNKSNLDEDIPE